MFERRPSSHFVFSFLGGLAMSVFLLAVTTKTCAQDLRYLRHGSWSTEQGLPQDSVHAIFQTSDGFLWIGTEGGLARFDGAGFAIFNHHNEKAFGSDDTCCLAEDGAGDLWVGTADGLLRMRGGRFGNIGAKDGLPSAAIHGLAVAPDGTLLVLTAGGLVQHKAERFEPVKGAPPDIDAIETAGKAGVWLVANGHVFLLQNGEVRPYALKWGESDRVEGIRRGPDDAVWAFSNRAVHVEGAGFARDWHVGAEVPGSRVESLFVDRNGTAWVGTNEGVTLLSRGANHPVTVPVLEGNAVLQTFQDREGSYWIGSESSGLHVLRTLKFRSELTNFALTALVQSGDGAVWVGTRRDGLRRLRGESVDEPAPSGRLTSPVILSLAAGSDGSVWGGTPDGLNHVSARGGVEQITSADGLPDDYVQSLAAAPDGSVWIGTRHGLVHRRGTQMHVLTKADGLGGDLIGTLLLARNGDLWIGTSGGLSRRSPDGRITNEGVPGRSQAVVSALAEDRDGAIWIAKTDGSLSRFGVGGFRRIEGSAFAGQVQGMAIDGEGYLWFRDLHDIERVSLADLNRCAASRESCAPNVSRSGVADGIPTDEMAGGGSPAILRLDSGEIWSITRRGAAITDPAHLPENRTAPPVVIESFLVNDVAAEINDGTVRIPSGRERFTIEYAGLSFVVPTAVRYRVRLEGFDPAWIDAGNKRSATYTNLPPGSYRFRVQAANNDGVWNDAGAALSFYVVPPLYRRWWFLALMLLCLVATGAGLYRLRLRVVRRQFEAVLRERSRMAREIHDTLAQDFVGVSLQLDIVSQLLSRNKLLAAAEQVGQTRRLVTEGLAEARQSIWELRANTAQDSLPSRLRKIIERYAGESVDVRTKIGGAFRPLDGRLEAEVLRVAQEALSNVARHSGAASASVELHYGRDMLVLTVEDNGRGFDVEQAAETEGHYGLNGLKERANLLGGTLEIRSRPGEGTRVRLAKGIDSGKSGAS